MMFRRKYSSLYLLLVIAVLSAYPVGAQQPGAVLQSSAPSPTALSTGLQLPPYVAAVTPGAAALSRVFGPAILDSQK